MSNHPKNLTELQSANVVHSGSGDVLISGNFAPPPTFPVNGSNLPHRYPDFVGRRDEIDKVMEALASRAWIVTIDGPGGIGKTTLALEVAHLCRERASEYPNVPTFTGYIWTSARGNQSFGLRDVIREILYVLSDYENTQRTLEPSEQLSLAIRALAAEPRLLIIDNFETVKDEPLHRFLRDQVPIPSKVLITSRHHIQSGERVVTMGGLDESDAVQLLRLEAARLQIPLTEQDETRLLIIARKTFGVPLVLRWAMESVYNGKTLEWVVESLEHATADDIFDYIFKLSLSILDNETCDIFRSMSLLPAWARIETIAALNPSTAAIQERVGQLVSLSLAEDNRRLVQSDRRYQLPSFARYLANKELSETDDKGKGKTEYALNYYLSRIEGGRPSSESIKQFLDEESANLSNVVRIAASFEDTSLLERCVELASIVRRIDRVKGKALFTYLIDFVHKTSDGALTLKLMKSMGSPYILGYPVTSPDFYGRQKLLNLIRSNFEGDKVDPVITLTGQRRIGKTSILKELRDKDTEISEYIAVDLQVIGRDTDKTNVLYFIAHEIWNELMPEIDGKLLAIDEPNIEDFREDVFRSFEYFIGQAAKAIGKRIVIMLDEFDMLFYRNNTNETERLLSYFRHLAQKGKLNMIVAGVSYPSEFPVSTLVSPLFNFAIPLTISFFDKEETVELIRKPAFELIKYDEEAIERIYKLTGGHPYITQLLCNEIFSLCLEMGTVVVNNVILNDSLLRISESGRYYFDYTIRQLPEAFQRKILAAAAHLSSSTDTGKFTLEQLKSFLGSQTVDDTQLKNVLKGLVRRELLSKDNKVEEYSFTMGLVVHWLIRNFPSVEDVP